MTLTDLCKQIKAVPTVNVRLVSFKRISTCGRQIDNIVVFRKDDTFRKNGQPKNWARHIFENELAAADVISVEMVGD